MNISRRQFVGNASFALVGAAFFDPARAADSPMEVPLIASTWGFGKQANEMALKVLEQGGSLLDAVEQGIGLIESSGNGSVGLTGGPNAAGVVQLDACI